MRGGDINSSNLSFDSLLTWIFDLLIGFVMSILKPAI